MEDVKMTMFKRLSFEEMNEEMQRASLSQPIDRFKTFDFDFEKAASYHFEDGRLVETHEGTMTLFKEWGDTQTFPMTRESFYDLNRDRLQRMESSFAVLKEEGFEKMIGRASILDIAKDDFRLSMKEVKTSFENELLDLKERAKPDFCFSFEYLTFLKMATYMNLQEGEQKYDVESKFPIHTLEG